MYQRLKDDMCGIVRVAQMEHFYHISIRATSAYDCGRNATPPERVDKEPINKNADEHLMYSSAFFIFSMTT